MSNQADILWKNSFMTAPIQQQLSASTFTNALLTPHYDINTTTPGANKIAEYACVTNDTADLFKMKRYSYSDTILTYKNYVNFISCFVSCYTAKSNLTATQYIGIEYGSIDVAPPFTSPPRGGVAQVRWVASTDSFELMTAKGDGSAPLVTPMRGVSNFYDTANNPNGVWMDLEVDPINLVVKGYINGVLGATNSGATFPTAALTHSVGAHQLVSGIFVTTGTSGSGSTRAFFNDFNHRVVDIKDWNYNVSHPKG